MKIVKCQKCGNYIPKAVKCYHCGNSTDFSETEEIAVHKNVAKDYVRMSELIEERKFDDAINLSHKILEWMPNLAGVFWLRLLAKNKCSTAAELITRGFPCDDDADLINALRFSSGEERIAYENIQKTVISIRGMLLTDISDHEYRCKSATNILEIREGFSEEIEKRKKKLFNIWSDLKEIEHALYALQTDCRLLAKERQLELEQAVQEAVAIKAEMDKMKDVDCTSERLYALQVRLGSILARSNSSREAIESMKNQHAWVAEFSEQISRRDQQIELINSEIVSLAAYEKKVQETISEIESIENKHKKARISADRYDFSPAASLIGTNEFEQILRASGVNSELFLNPLSADY